METKLTEQAQLLTERRTLKIGLQSWSCGNAFPIAERSKPRHSIAFWSTCRYWILISSMSNTSIPNGARLP